MSARTVLRHLLERFGYRVQVSRYTAKRPGEEIVISVGGFRLRAGADHGLPGILEAFPGYSSNLPRVVACMEEKYRDLVLVDVGANIGDTVALVRQWSACPILCFEADDRYYRLLLENIRQFAGVSAVQAALGAEEQVIAASLHTERGTARITAAGGGNILRITTIDAALSNSPLRGRAKVLKVDTDGYDLRVLRGARGYLAGVRPALFFEYDPDLWAEEGEAGLSALRALAEVGYETILLYDNCGRFLVGTDLSHEAQLGQLHRYVAGKRGRFEYFDLAVFHRDDADVGRTLVSREVALP